MRIGVWNTAFLGDAVLTLPLVQTVRLNFPEAVLDFYVRGGLGPLFTAHPAIDNVYEFEKNGRHKGLGAARRFGGEVAGRGYDIWISAHTSPRSGLIARASGAELRIGYKEAWHSRLWYNKRVARRFGELDEVPRLLQLAEPLALKFLSCWPEIVLPLEASVRAEAEFAGIFRKYGCYRPVVGLHPGSVWPTKRWPAEKFAETGLWAVENGAAVMLFAGKGEEEIAARVKALMLEKGGAAAEEHLYDFSGQLSLPELAAFLRRLAAYVTNDSGPMHLAWAQDTPVAALFGPTVRKLGFFPRGPQSQVFEVDLACRPCGLHGHKKCPLGHHDCMEKLEVADVTAELSRFLEY